MMTPTDDPQPEGVFIGDRMRFSVELLQQIADQPDGRSVVVMLESIREEEDGTKTLMLVRWVP